MSAESDFDRAILPAVQLQACLSFGPRRSAHVDPGMALGGFAKLVVDSAVSSHHLRSASAFNHHAQYCVGEHPR